jgi:catalase-peroxidase
MNERIPDKTSTATHEMTGKCPFGGDRVGGALGTPPTLENWYPDRLRVELLHQNGLAADPLGADFDYAAAFAQLDFDALKRDIKPVVSQRSHIRAS